MSPPLPPFFPSLKRCPDDGKALVDVAVHDRQCAQNRQVEQPKECRFSPYQNNGGTCLAIAGKDFCIVAADSRLSLGYSILSRTSPKVAQLTTKCCIASSGCQADMVTLQKFLKFRLQVTRDRNQLACCCTQPLMGAFAFADKCGGRCTRTSMAKKCQRLLLVRCWQLRSITDDSFRTTPSMSWADSTKLVHCLPICAHAERFLDQWRRFATPAAGLFASKSAGSHDRTQGRASFTAMTLLGASKR